MFKVVLAITNITVELAEGLEWATFFWFCSIRTVSPLCFALLQPQGNQFRSIWICSDFSASWRIRSETQNLKWQINLTNILKKKIMSCLVWGPILKLVYHLLFTSTVKCSFSFVMMQTLKQKEHSFAEFNGVVRQAAVKTKRHIHKANKYKTQSKVAKNDKPSHRSVI